MISGAKSRGAGFGQPLPCTGSRENGAAGAMPRSMAADHYEISAGGLEQSAQTTSGIEKPKKWYRLIWWINPGTGEAIE